VSRSPLVDFARELLRVPDGCGLLFYVRYRALQVVGINWRTPWPVHWTTQVNNPQGVKIGRRTFPGDSPHCYINGHNGIEIGDDCNLGPGVGLISANHDLGDNSRFQPAPPIRLGRRCWVGMNAVILPGVTLGENTIVGAGAIVTKSFPEGWCVLAGNPARVIRKLDPAKDQRRANHSP
jgi:acetyltransferase-like isoleucine patch superfamily enzyme